MSYTLLERRVVDLSSVLPPLIFFSTPMIALVVPRRDRFVDTPTLTVIRDNRYANNRDNRYAAPHSPDNRYPPLPVIKPPLVDRLPMRI